MNPTSWHFVRVSGQSYLLCYVFHEQYHRICIILESFIINNNKIIRKKVGKNILPEQNKKSN